MGMKMNHGENNTTMKPVKKCLNGRTTQIKHMKTIHGEKQYTWDYHFNIKIILNEHMMSTHAEKVLL